MNRLLLLFLTFLTVSLSYAQNIPHDCGTDEVMEELYKQYPELLEKQKESERFYQSEVRRKSKQASWRSTADVVTIPVVIHVMHLPGTPIGTDENISDAQIEAGMLHLNQAFRKQTADFNGIGHNPNIVGVDCEINFCLAKQDPDGNPTNGVNRVATTLTNTNYIGSSLSLKNLSRWNPNRYLNIWLVKSIYDSSTGRYIGGFSTFSSSHGSVFDGLVCKVSRFGSSLTSTLSRTHIHEIGHYLNLKHTFQGGCPNTDCLNNGDGVCDTPPEANKTILMPCGDLINTCSTDADDPRSVNPFRLAPDGLGDQVDLSENYMDYTDSLGNCVINTFTQGQKVRMRAALDGDRILLKTSLGCVPAPTTSVAYFGYNDSPPFGEYNAVVGIDCRNYIDVNVPIKLLNTPSGGTINISVGAGTATNMADFQLMTPSVTIPAGSTTANAVLRVFDDIQLEDIETVVLNMSSATAGITSSTLPYVFSIEDDDYALDGNFTTVAFNISSISEEYLGPYAKVYFIAPLIGLLATIENLSNHDYGCTTVEIDRAGATTTTNAGKTFMTKTLKVTPTNNNPSGQHKTTLYFTSEEVSAWTSATGAGLGAMSLFKSSGAIGSATSVVEGTSVTAVPFGASTAFSATFSTGFSGFGVANNTVLAVDLLNFEGIKGNKNVKLRWKTASEKNNDYFVIEKSSDGQTFEAMTKVTSQGIASGELNYETLDNNPSVGMNYYRLKSVDKGGQVATSKVVSVAFVEKIKLTVYPNPTTVSKINVELTSDRDDRIDFEVVDVVGKTVHTMSQNVTNGLNTIAFDNLTVSKGIYT
jgi:hypothetical protein